MMEKNIVGFLFKKAQISNAISIKKAWRNDYIKCCLTFFWQRAKKVSFILITNTENKKII